MRVVVGHLELGVDGDVDSARKVKCSLLKKLSAKIDFDSSKSRLVRPVITSANFWVCFFVVSPFYFERF